MYPGLPEANKFGKSLTVQFYHFSKYAAVAQLSVNTLLLELNLAPRFLESF